MNGLHFNELPKTVKQVQMEKIIFLAPTGAQGVSLSVCPSVRLSGTKCSRALNLHLIFNQTS